MKNLQYSLYALFLGAVITGIGAFTSLYTDHDGASASHPEVIGASLGSDRAQVEIGLRGHPMSGILQADGVFMPVPMLVTQSEGGSGEAALTHASAPVQSAAVGGSRQGRAEMIAEVDRIMLRLYQDGLLDVPTSIACAHEDTTRCAGTARILLERFRHIHQEYGTLTKSAVSMTGRAPATREWTELHWDVAIIKKLAAQLRAEHARPHGPLTTD